MTPPKARKAAEAPPAPAEDPLAAFRDTSTDRTGVIQQENAEQPAQDPLATVVGEAVGAASMCWEPTPAGVFQSEQASAIVDGLLGMLHASGVGVVTQEAWDDARAVVIAGWHADTVSLGFLHKGGNCGCRYLAGIALQAAMPIQPDLEPQEA